LGCLFNAIASFALAACLGSRANGYSYVLPRFLLLVSGVLTSVACWCAAVYMVVMHRRIWPLVLTTAGVLTCAAGFWILVN